MISDPTVRGYAEGFVGQGRDYLGGGTGVSGGMPTTRGFDAAMQRAIEGL